MAPLTDAPLAFTTVMVPVGWYWLGLWDWMVTCTLVAWPTVPVLGALTVVVVGTGLIWNGTFVTLVGVHAPVLSMVIELIVPAMVGTQVKYTFPPLTLEAGIDVDCGGEL